MSPMYTPDPPFEEAFSVGDRMVLMGLEYTGTINTRFGPAQKTLVKLVTRESYPQVLTYSAIGSGFRALAERADASDFPHVAEFITVDLPGGKHVKRFAPVPKETGSTTPLEPRAWVDGEDGGEVDRSVFASASAAGPATAAGGDTVSF